MVRVLFVTHQLAMNMYGGAETQMLQTMEAINHGSSEYRVELFNQWSHKIRDGDIVHIFNPGSFPTEASLIAQYARKSGAKVVVSPITYHSSKLVREQGSLAMFLMDKMVGNYRRPLRWPILRYFDPLRYLESCFRNAHLLLPNTTEELEGLISRYNAPQERCQIVPNGVEGRFLQSNPALFTSKTGFKNFLLYVGKIDERKNIVTMLRAYAKSGLPTPLIIIGEPTSTAYLEKCKREANGHVIFMPPIQHDDPLLASAYAASDVLLLPSYYETPGLSALEAALAGAKIVITSVGGTRDYFQNQAYYVNPFDEKDITKKMIQAHDAPREEGLRKAVAAKFTWEKVGDATLKSYESLRNINLNK